MTPTPYGSLGERLADDLDVGILLGQADEHGVVAAGGVGFALLDGDEAIGDVRPLDDLQALVLRFAELFEVGAPSRHAHPGPGGDEVIDAGVPRAAPDEHLLAGVVVGGREGDAQPAVAVDRHRVGHEVDVAGFQRRKALRRR